MKSLQPIRFVDLETGLTHEEAVYGGFWVKLLYGSWLGGCLAWLVAAPPLSRIYGWLQDRAVSKRKVAPFIKRFQIDMDDFLPEEGRPPDDPYASFNSFFTRRIAPGARPVVPAPQFPAPCDARYFGYQSLDETVSVPVKGASFAAAALLKNERWAATFERGPAFIARLCPVDYHRFHFPDDGEVLASWRIPGALHSVNPWALAFRDDIFMVNERQVSILKTANFGTLACVEVGATCVGRIVQTYSGAAFRRGTKRACFCLAAPR